VLSSLNYALIITDFISTLPNEAYVRTPTTNDEDGDYAYISNSSHLNPKEPHEHTQNVYELVTRDKATVCEAHNSNKMCPSPIYESAAEVYEEI